jgi:hypothetical protein
MNDKVKVTVSKQVIDGLNTRYGIDVLGEIKSALANNELTKDQEVELKIEEIVNVQASC